ncbi:MAG: hypothetical protein ACRCWF_06195 [Beijerinckiaceae bacterium]
MTETSPTFPGRTCGTCTLCCKVYEVPPVSKPRDQWCKHCKPGQGCSIWEDRPQFCRDFHCTWIQDTSFGPEWQPSVSKFVMNWADEKQLFVTVDHTQPVAYRREPYYSHFKKLAANWLPSSRFIVIFVGDKKMLLLPDGEQYLGTRNDTASYRVVTHLARSTDRYEIVIEASA